LFASAQAAEQAGDIAKAERLYRILTKTDPMDASAGFNLGRMIRDYGRYVEAEVALRAATQIDPAFAGARYNLGNGSTSRDVTKPPSNACARRCRSRLTTLFNLALLLQRKNRHAEAADKWCSYLAIERQSERPTRTRRSLKFYEMQQHLIV
jgi:tetratricopeptide (TPR) repeat protein